MEWKMRLYISFFVLQMLLGDTLSMMGTVTSVQQLSLQQKRELLDTHNYLRSIVSPTATNMQRMRWSEELAKVAQDYAEECNFAHNPHRSNKTQLFSYIGENIAITNNPLVNYTDLVYGWYNENKFYDIVKTKCMGYRECRHYTQVVWATSTWLGCGMKRCGTTVGFPHSSSSILVCNYGPGGNTVGEGPYVPGILPCSLCPDDQPFCQNSLCSNELTSVYFYVSFHNYKT